MRGSLISCGESGWIQIRNDVVVDAPNTQLLSDKEWTLTMRAVESAAFDRALHNDIGGSDEDTDSLLHLTYKIRFGGLRSKQ